MPKFNFSSLSQDKEEKVIPKQKVIPKKSKKVIPKKSKNIHHLTEENLLTFIRMKGSIKLYEAYWFFLSDNPEYSAKNIDSMIQRLKRDGKLRSNRNGWISLNL